MNPSEVAFGVEKIGFNAEPVLVELPPPHEIKDTDANKHTRTQEIRRIGKNSQIDRSVCFTTNILISLFIDNCQR